MSRTLLYAPDDTRELMEAPVSEWTRPPPLSSREQSLVKEQMKEMWCLGSCLVHFFRGFKVSRTNFRAGGRVGSDIRLGRLPVEDRGNLEVPSSCDPSKEREGTSKTRSGPTGDRL